MSEAKVTHEQLITSYIYKLSKNIEWNNDKKTFSIHLVSSDNILNSEFMILAKNIRLNDKKIIITISEDEKVAKDSDVVFVTKDKERYYKKIFQATKNNHALLISNDYKNKKFVMINLYKTDSNTIDFEINRANILSKGLGIKPDMIMLGGTELDVAYLYRDARDELSSKDIEIQKIHKNLDKSKKRLAISKINLKTQKKKLKDMKEEVSLFKKKNSELKKKINDKEKVLAKTKKEIQKYNKNVTKLKKSITDKNTKITLQEKKLLTISSEFNTTKNDLKKIKSSLTKQMKELQTKQSLLKKQIIKVVKKEQHLVKLETMIEDKTKEFELLKSKLDEQNKILMSHEKTIDKQKDFLEVAIMALIVFLLIVIFIGYLLKKQRATNLLLKSTQEELEVAKNIADNASLNKSKFLASMSHELRTPLNAVLGYSQLLQRDKSFSEKHQKTFATIRNSGEHLLALINDILLISKMEAGHVEVNNKNANIHELLENIHSMFTLKTDKKAISLTLNIEDALPKHMIIDIDKIRQILINLLNNSVKFTNKGGITIGADAKDEYLLISVKDSGVGVAQEEVDKLFKQYEQTQSGVEEGNGTGLGLALVKEFCDLLDGAVSVTSVLGEGSEFKIKLPYEASNEEVQTQKLPTVVRLAPNQRDFRVLIVDDIETNRDLLTELFTEVGFKTSQVVNGLEAVKWVKNARPDIIMMDLRMPIMDGREATKKILEMDSSIPIIAITASILEMESLIKHPDPFIAAIPKPFDENTLLHLVEKYMDLEYIYEEEDKDAKDKAIIDIDLGVLPIEIREELLKATKSMNITVVGKLIESLGDDFGSEKNYMQSLVADFNFAKLEEMLTD